MSYTLCLTQIYISFILLYLSLQPTLQQQHDTIVHFSDRIIDIYTEEDRIPPLSALADQSAIRLYSHLIIKAIDIPLSLDATLHMLKAHLDHNLGSPFPPTLFDLLKVPITQAYTCLYHN